MRSSCCVGAWQLSDCLRGLACILLGSLLVLGITGPSLAQGLGAWTLNSSNQFLSVGVGPSPVWNKEDRNYFRNAFASNNPYNTDYQYKDTGLGLLISPYYNGMPSAGSACEFQGNFIFSLRGDREVNYYSKPIPGPITQDVNGAYGDFRWQYADLFVAGARLIGDDMAVTGRYDFFKTSNSRDWGFHINRFRAGDPLSTVNRDDAFSLKDDLCSHHLSVGIRSLSGEPQELTARTGSQTVRGKPTISSGEYFMRSVYSSMGPSFSELNAGVHLVRDHQTRWFSNADATWISLDYLGAPEFIFYQEEDYANVPREIDDNYEQFFVEFKTRYNWGGNANVGFEGAYYAPVRWNRDVSLLDGPYFQNLNAADPARTYDQIIAEGKRELWNVYFDVNRPISSDTDISFMQTAHGRSCVYSLGFNTNWAPGASTAGRQTFDEAIREYMFESALAWTKRFGRRSSSGPLALGLRNRTYLREGQAVCRAFAGYRYRNYRRSLQSVYVLGPDYFNFHAKFGQFFCGGSYANALSRSTMLAIDFQWDARTDYTPDATYQWVYSSNNYSEPGGSGKGSNSGVLIDATVTYMPSDDFQLAATLQYNYKRVTSDFAWGPIFIYAPPALLGFYDTYQVTWTNNDLSFMVSMGLLY